VGTTKASITAASFSSNSGSASMVATESVTAVAISKRVGHLTSPRSPNCSDKAEGARRPWGALDAQLLPTHRRPMFPRRLSPWLLGAGVALVLAGVGMSVPGAKTSPARSPDPQLALPPKSMGDAPCPPGSLPDAGVCVPAPQNGPRLPTTSDEVSAPPPARKR
jgi:hypothetical protein